MAILTEQFASRVETIETDNPSAERVYVVKGAASEEVAKATFLALGAKVHNELKLKTWSVDERLTPTSWKIVAKYERPEPETEAGIKSVPSLDISNATVHIENSYKTLIAVGPEAEESRVGNSNPIDFDGTTVRGADVLEAVTTLSITQTLAEDAVTNAYTNLVIGLVGKTNEQVFTFYGDDTFSYGIGDVLFLGASIVQKESREWEVVLKFGIKPAIPAATVGSISVPERPGWSYQWVEYGDKKSYIQGPWVNGEQPFVVKRVPVAVYVEQVFPEGPLHQLAVEGF